MKAHNHTGLSGIGTWIMQYLGEVIVSWVTEGDRRTLTIEIPPGCVGKLQLPDEEELHHREPWQHEVAWTYRNQYIGKQ